MEQAIGKEEVEYFQRISEIPAADDEWARVCCIVCLFGCLALPILILPAIMFGSISLYLRRGHLPAQKYVEAYFNEKSAELDLKQNPHQSDSFLGLFYADNPNTGRMYFVVKMNSNTMFECLLSSTCTGHTQLIIEHILPTASKLEAFASGHTPKDEILLLSEEAAAYEDDPYNDGFGSRRSLRKIWQEDYGNPKITGIGITSETAISCDRSAIIPLFGKDISDAALGQRLAIAEQWCLSIDRMTQRFDYVDDDC